MQQGRKRGLRRRGEVLQDVRVVAEVREAAEPHVLRQHQEARRDRRRRDELQGRWHLQVNYRLTPILMSKVQFVLCFEKGPTEGRGRKKGGSANSKTKHTEPMTSELILPVYINFMMRAYLCLYSCSRLF